MKIINQTIAIAMLSLSMSACVTTEFISSTSSTLDAVTPDVTANEFVTKRYVAIRKEAAKGQGEHLDALAHLMGQQDSDAFAQYMQTNFEQIFSNVNAPADILARIDPGSPQKG